MEILCSPEHDRDRQASVQILRYKNESRKKMRSIRERGPDPAKIQSDDLALLALIKKQFGDNAAEVIRNLDFAKKTIGNIPEEKRVDLETACEAFVDRQIRAVITSYDGTFEENRNRRTVYSDRQALRYFCQFAGGGSSVMELTETKINDYFDTMKPGGRRRTQHSRLIVRHRRSKSDSSDRVAFRHLELPATTSGRFRISFAAGGPGQEIGDREMAIPRLSNDPRKDTNR